LSGLKYGDLVTLYIDDRRKYVVKLVENGVVGLDKGFVKHDHIVGLKYGDMILTSRGAECYLLKPLPQDYQHVIRRKTQIIYPKDASLMIYLSGLKPGSKVLEAGVGSGCLTISLAHIVGESGHVYGFDINPEHLEIARENLSKTNLLDRVSLELRDIREGVGLSDLDAVFYDLPDPWNALDTAYSVLKRGYPIIIYVPTINQVEKTVEAMREKKGFIDIHVYEVLLREYEVEKNAVRPKTIMIGHTGYIVFSRTISR